MQDRCLPEVDVTPETLTDAYVEFILFCNPQFPLDVDASQLRAKFNAAPRSDNKEFQIYRLFELIRQLDAKEIETWGQLALDLGVDPPDVSKNQSIQKVQQYTVRLKRWMRAMHIDAFFEYLIGKRHSYFTDVPSPDDPYPAAGRDGVPVEDDLAVRALEPAFRPKRGRRRNSETEQDEDGEAGRQRRLAGFGHPGSAHPKSALPMTAHPAGEHDPWAAASAMSGHTFAPWQRSHMTPHSAVTPSVPPQLRWPMPEGQSHPIPSSPHPMTAHPGGSAVAHLEAAYADEPKSAITPSSRKRRKHYPAVSSAWPTSNASGAKPRGRPPASRNTQDGPFNTFPADPSNDRPHRISSPLTVSKTPDDSMEVTEAGAAGMPPPSTNRPLGGPGRPGRLSLQVPQHTGAPVRLATPPRVIVSGETRAVDSESRSVSYTPDSMQGPSARREGIPSIHVPAMEFPGFSFEALKRVLASDLLRAELTGRAQRLTGDEAKRLADAVLERLNVPRTDRSNVPDSTARLTAASWLGLGEQLHVPLGPAVGQTKKIRVTRFRTDAEGYEEIVSTSDEGLGTVREVVDISWSVVQGTCRGSFELAGLTLAPTPRAPRSDHDIHDLVLAKVLEASKMIGNPEDDQTVLARARRSVDKYRNVPGAPRAAGDDGVVVDWEAKYNALLFGLNIAHGEFDRFKERMLAKTLEVFL